MSTFLSPAQYNQAELDGLALLCCRAIECFRPSQFAAVGYPFVINSMSELWRYTESMHEALGLPQPMEEYLMANLLIGGFTEQEIEEAKRIKQALDDISHSIGRPVEYPVYSMFLAFNQARHISCLAASGSTIVELGGGAGYLGALLVLRGYRYIATDVAQAFYILQSNLLDRLSAGGVIDLVDKQHGADDLRTLKPGQAAMVPWWRWAQRSTLAGLSIDLVTSNHNLLEMHPRSRLYHLAAVRESLSPEGTGFVFEGWGDGQYPRWTAVKDFSNHGFVLAHNDLRITCFAPKERHAEGVLLYPLSPEAGKPPEKGPADEGPSERSGDAHTSNEVRGSAALLWEQAQRRVLDVPSRADVDARFRALDGALLAQKAELSARLDRIERPVPVDQNEVQFAAPYFSNERNAISHAIMSMRSEEQSKARLSLEDYKNCFGIDEIWTEDDRFLAYVYRGTSLGKPWVTALPK